MKSKDQQLLEEAYKKVCENMAPPQPGEWVPGPAFNDKVSDTLWSNADTPEEKLAAGAYDLYHDKEDVIKEYGGENYPENDVKFWIQMGKYLKEPHRGEVEDHLRGLE